jgi:membrane-bound lytic murein transglycosylase B
VASDADMSLVETRDFKPRKTVAELAEHGFRPARPVDGGTPAAIASLEEADGDHFFVTFKNFYVITRYNRSPLYAMAVYELSEAIRSRYEE